MKNISLKVEESDFRPAFVFDDVSQLEMDRIKVEDTNDKKQVVFRDVSGYKTDFPEKAIQEVK